MYIKESHEKEQRNVGGGGHEKEQDGVSVAAAAFSERRFFSLSKESLKRAYEELRRVRPLYYCAVYRQY